MAKAIAKKTRVVYQLPRFIERITPSYVSFNVFFRARSPLGFGLVFEIRGSHSLLHAHVEIGMITPDLPASTKVNSEEWFWQKSVRVCSIPRGWYS